MIRSRRLALTIVVGAVVASACSIPVDESPQPFDQERAEAMLQPSSSAVETQPVDEDDENLQTRTLFFIVNDAPEDVERAFSESPLLNEVLSQLSVAPTSQDEGFEQSMSTLIVGQPRRVGRSPLNNQILQIEVPPDTGYLEKAGNEPEQARLIAAQIICTAFGLGLTPPINGVELLDTEGDPLPLTDSNGSPITGPGLLENYDGCIPASELAAEEAAEEAAEDEETTTTGG